MIKKVIKGLKEPNKMLPYILGRSLSSSTLERAQQKQTRWKKEGGYYTFEIGGFAGGTEDRPEFAARNYYEISTLRQVMMENNISVERAAEIGSGYGRLAPWISDFSSEYVGIEPNERAIERAKDLYPDLAWRNSRLQDLDCEGQDFDLTVTWTVLQHIPPEDIEQVVRKIRSMTAQQGQILICEETQGGEGSHTWPRSPERYDELFGSWNRKVTKERVLEPTYSEHGGKIMLYESA
jgi:SAM-dependent methyltransferase